MSVNKSKKEGNIFSHIVGEQLSAVVFVMDYIQFQFDADVLTVFNPVGVKINNRMYNLGELSFRDNLCERISHIVKEVLLSTEELEINFDDTSSFLISLKDEDTSDVEKLNFNWIENGEERFLVM